jgi:hypothetical protein
MARCVVFAVNGSGTETTLSRDALNPAGATNFSGCAFVVETGPEYAARLVRDAQTQSSTTQTTSYPAWNELGSLSIADAQVISGYVGLLWAGVWGIKQIVKSVSIFERNQDE